MAYSVYHTDDQSQIERSRWEIGPADEQGRIRSVIDIRLDEVRVESNPRKFTGEFKLVPKINWHAIGSQEPETAAEFGRALVMASVIAEQFTERHGETVWAKHWQEGCPLYQITTYTGLEECKCHEIAKDKHRRFVRIDRATTPAGNPRKNVWEVRVRNAEDSGLDTVGSIKQVNGQHGWQYQVLGEKGWSSEYTSFASAANALLLTTERMPEGGANYSGLPY